MKRIFIFIMTILVVFSLTGCSSIKDVSGIYEFAELIYMSLISSATPDYIESRMAGTKYIIDQDVFEIDSPYDDYKITQPIYVKEKMDTDMVKGFNDSFLDSRLGYEYGAASISEYKNKYRYTLYISEDEKSHFYLYSDFRRLSCNSRVQSFIILYSQYVLFDRTVERSHKYALQCFDI